MLELPKYRPPGIREVIADLDRNVLSTALVAAIFATTGPLAVILAVGRAGNLDDVVMTGWLFGAFFIGGCLTVLMSWFYRQPLGMAWAIPAAAVLLSSLGRNSFGEMVGATLITGLILALLGASGLVEKVMSRLPVPIVMGMVAGVFLPFGMEIVEGTVASPILAAAAPYRLHHRHRHSRRGARLPADAGSAPGDGRRPDLERSRRRTQFRRPMDRPPSTAFRPEFTPSAMIELVPAFLVAVIAIQNLQGITVVRQAGHPAPTNMLTVGCGFGSLAMGALGSVPACVTGPVNAILTSAGPPSRHYAGAILFGLLIGLFGFFSPITIQLAGGVPPAVIGVLGGLAMLPVLIASFRAAFGTSRGFGPFVAFLVTLGDVPLFGIGAPFWGLIAGLAAAAILDRKSP